MRVQPECSQVKSQAAKPAKGNPVLQMAYESWGSFGRFLKLIEKSSSVSSEEVGHLTPPEQQGDSSLFPSMLVIPRVLGKPSSARRRARGRGQAIAWEWVKVLWSLFTFLDAGAPFKSSEQQKLLSRARAACWTPMHAEYAGLLHKEINRFVRLWDNSDPLSRGLLKLDELIKKVKASQYGGINLASNLSNVAKDVKPERMSLPSTAGIIDPKKFLKGHHLESFMNMARDIPSHDTPVNPTKGCFKVRDQDLIAVYHKLLDSGVAVLLPENQAVRDDEGRIITGGLFAVDHKPSSDRIILDRRPFNELEKRLVWAKLPHGCLLTQLIVPKGCSVRGSGDDLSNYFYLLQHESSWLPRNAIGTSFDGRGFEAYGGVPGESYVLAFKVVAMGDLNAVDISQQVHLEILRDAGCMQDHEVLAFKHCLPASHCYEGLYIDDHIVVQVLPSKKYRSKHATFRDDEILEASRNQYARHDVPVSQKKAFSREPRFVAWGTEVCNASGRVGTPLVKLRHLSELLVKACTLKTVSKRMMQQLSGLLIHPFMHRRMLMSLLSETFTWTEGLSETDSRSMPASVREELIWSALCLPLAHMNIRWEISNRIACSDASLKMGGRCAATTTPEIAKTLYRFSEHRGEHIRLDWSNGALAPASTMEQVPQEIEDLIADHHWTETDSCYFYHKQHINLLEEKMIHRELVDVVHNCRQPLRCLLVVDSRAAAGAWSKGRSSSRQLNRLIRKSLGWSLAGQKTLHLIWVKSAANPADHPSRGKKIPSPSKRPKPISRSVLGNSLKHIQKRRSKKTLWKLVTQQPKQQDNPDEVSCLDKEASSRQTSTTCGSHAKGSHPARAHWSFKEMFAGHGMLTKVFRERGNIPTLHSFEILRNGKVVANQDILNDATFGELCLSAKVGKQIWHFAFPCGSFSLLQNLNGGTRSNQNPLGTGVLDREIKGNEIWHRTIYLCQLLHDHGSFFSLENPLTSFAWKFPKYLELVKRTGLLEVHLDQCCYNLRIPDSSGKLGLAKKPTQFSGSLPGLSRLGRRCNRLHEHVPVIGGVRFKGKWVRRSQLAGAYPKKLCLAYANICEDLFN